MQRIDQTCGTDHSCTVLIIVENRDVHDLFQGLFNDETLRCLDVFEVNPPKRRPHKLHGIDKLLRIFCV